jgi:hypothetical protein
LDRFYEVGLGLQEFSNHLSKTVKQIVHRNPRMKMLEIGENILTTHSVQANMSIRCWDRWLHQVDHA